MLLKRWSNTALFDNIFAKKDRKSLFYPPQTASDATIPTKIRNGNTFNSKVMAHASPTPPAPKSARIPSTIRNVVSMEPLYANIQTQSVRI